MSFFSYRKRISLSYPFRPPTNVCFQGRNGSMEKQTSFKNCTFRGRFDTSFIRSWCPFRKLKVLLLQHFQHVSCVFSCQINSKRVLHQTLGHLPFILIVFVVSFSNLYLTYLERKMFYMIKGGDSSWLNSNQMRNQRGLMMIIHFFFSQLGVLFVNSLIQ